MSRVTAQRCCGTASPRCGSPRSIGIPAWIAHLMFVAAMVRFTDSHSQWEWTLHAATAVTALVTIAGMAVCFDLLARGGPLDHRSRHSRRHASPH